MADTIAAIATGKAPCAIGILRLSGDGCAEIAGRVVQPVCGRPLSQCENRKLTLSRLYDRDGRLIDEVLAVYTRAPHTYTGEDTVELQCHGSPAALAAGLEALLCAGARQAGPGEFTKRAFLNGQMDLTQAEAVIDLIDAETADAAANAAGQIGGALRRRLDPIYAQLTDICSHFHAVLDYPDEDIEEIQLTQWQAVLEDARHSLAELLATCSRGQILKKGVRTAIVGRPNAGKSSLLNALAGYERVIVTEIAGTTRDTVEESVLLGGVLLRLTDTAGIHETSDRIEALGVARSLAAVREADLALFVCDGSVPLNEEDLRAMEAAKTARRVLAIVNKTDRPQVVQPTALPFPEVISLSAATGEGIDRLRDTVSRLFADSTPCDGSILTNARQAGAAEHAQQSLAAALTSLRSGMTPDAVLVDVEEAMQALGELTGRVVREDITNRIFERFCVGK